MSIKILYRWAIFCRTYIVYSVFVLMIAQRMKNRQIQKRKLNQYNQRTNNYNYIDDLNYDKTRRYNGNDIKEKKQIILPKFSEVKGE